ncbi:MAG TPA: hypothetical protein DDZ39_06480, partial [Flavobacteriaceae bacterium]|nr:hypothetical protein [Flavobacteriaceae bacterium]
MKTTLFILSLLFVTSTYAQVEVVTPPSNDGSIIIDSLTVKKHLYTLADDAMEGRKIGTPGIEKAAQYIESEFESIGLTKFKNLSSFRQDFKENGLDLFNIIGVLEGHSKKDEYVVVSAHYDHLG